MVSAYFTSAVAGGTRIGTERVTAHCFVTGDQIRLDVKGLPSLKITGSPRPGNAGSGSARGTPVLRICWPLLSRTVKLHKKRITRQRDAVAGPHLSRASSASR